MLYSRVLVVYLFYIENHTSDDVIVFIENAEESIEFIKTENLHIKFTHIYFYIRANKLEKVTKF